MPKYVKQTVRGIRCPCGWTYVAKTPSQKIGDKQHISVRLHLKVCSGIVKDEFVMGSLEDDKQVINMLDNLSGIGRHKLVDYASRSNLPF